MTRALVSVVVPTYNRAYCLPRTLDSVLAQTYGDLEILLVDDGSRDETAELVRTRYGREPRVKYIYQDNQGVSGARNRGLAEARGEFIALLDSDDVWKPWKLEAQIACLNYLPQAGMVWTDMEAIGPEGDLRCPKFLHTMYDAYRHFRTADLFTDSWPLTAASPQLAVLDGTLYLGDIFGPMLMGNLVHTSTVVMRRERQQKVGDFRLDLRVAGEDHDFHFRTCREGPVAFLDVASIQYQVGMPDRLSKHSLMVARNYLTTITSRLNEDKERLRQRVPAWMIHRALAHAHRWLGVELEKAGDLRAARGQYFASLRHAAWQPRLAALTTLLCLPGFVERPLRGGYHWLKRTVAGKKGPDFSTYDGVNADVMPEPAAAGKEP